MSYVIGIIQDDFSIDDNDDMSPSVIAAAHAAEVEAKINELAGVPNPENPDRITITTTIIRD